MSNQVSEIQALLQRAVAAHGDGNLPQAETLYREVLSKSPGQPTALYLLGVVALQVGRADVAAELIGQSLERQPQNPEAHYNLGNAYLALGRPVDAEESFREAVRLQPDNAAAHYNLGNLQKDAGLPAAAEQSFRAAVRHKPDLAQAWCNLGLVLDQQERREEAVEAYRTGLKAAPKLAEGHNNLGNVLMRLGRLEQAVACYREAVAANPLYGSAYRNLGTALRGLASKAGRDMEPSFRRALLIDPGDAQNSYNLGTHLEGSDAALRWFRRALAVRPHYTAALYNAGSALLSGGFHGEAEEVFNRLVAMRPGDAKNWGNLGAARQSLGDMRSAWDCYRKGLCLEPGRAGMAANGSTVAQAIARYDEAVSLARHGVLLEPLSATMRGALGLALRTRGELDLADRALRLGVLIAPEKPAQYINLSFAQREMRRLYDAERSLRRALLVAPEDPRVLMFLSSLLADFTRFEEALELGTKAIDLTPEDPAPYHYLLFYLHYIPRFETTRMMELYRRFDDAICAPRAKLRQPLRNSKDTEKRLRIGYVGAAFQRHSSASFFLPLLRHHDRERFEIFSYAFHKQEADAFTEEMKNLSDHWIPTFELSDAALAERVRADGIDLLADLSGHTKDNRLLTFAEKPAPVSFHWLDHGVTTGMTAIDYFLGDPVFTPEGSEEFFSETVWNLPRLAFPFTPLERGVPVSASPASANGYVTFGILSRTIRINDQAIALWSRILDRVPRSRFAMFSDSFQDPEMRLGLMERFRKFGIGPERLTIGFCPDARDAHGQIDILLDTFPHNAGVTFYECVYMGLPAVTLRGKPAIGTVGSSMLTQLGRVEWIAETESEYVRIACDLASDPARLVRLRQTLRTEMEASPIMDGAAFARDFEQACRTMWAKWCASGDV